MTQTVTQIIGDWLLALSKLLKIMVGTTGFEPATSSVSRKRSNQLSYAPAIRQRLVYQHQTVGQSRAVASTHRCCTIYD
jgi:hypothetical protein